MERTEHIILKGHVGEDDLEKYNEIVMQDNVKSIDIADLESDMDEDSFFDRASFYETEPLLIEKLLSNKRFSQSYIIEGNLVLSADRKVIVNSFDKASITIPESVEIIGDFAFHSNQISSIIIPNRVKIIGISAFDSCVDLDDLQIPDSVEQLGYCAFSSCSLDKVKLSSRLQEIPDGCFEYNIIENIDIPSSVKRIGSAAFHCDILRRVILPEGVEAIGSNVFTHCNEYIYFPSTMREIEKDFFYEDCIDIPEDCVPYIEVNEDNPHFFSKDGTLYSYEDPDTPYLGYECKGNGNA